MRVLVAYGSERGGTAEIAERVAETLRAEGLEAEAVDASKVRRLDGYDAVVIGGALYAMQWHRDARRFALRHARALREREVYGFSSGPLDDSASQRDIPPPPSVKQLLEHVGARSHVTFGGRLVPDARGVIASKMANDHAGDWRDWPRIESWARRIAAALSQPRSAPARPVPLPSRSLPLGLALFTGITALGGGAALMAGPDGSVVHMPVTALAHSPFHSFLIPGIVLFTLVGLLNLWAAWMHGVRSPYAALASFTGGCSLTIWVAVEMAMLRTVEWLQLTYLAIGILLVLDGARRASTLFAQMGAAARQAPRSTT